MKLGIKWYQIFEIKLIVEFFKCERPNHLHERYMSKRILFFAFLMCSLSFRAQSAKKVCPRFGKFNFREKLQNIFKTVIVQKSLKEKKYSEILFFIGQTSPLTCSS